MERINIRIKRKRAFSGFLLRESIYVDGKPVSGLKNGGSACVSVKRGAVVFIQEEFSVNKNAVILPEGPGDISLETRMTGSVASGYRCVFCPEGSDTPCRSVSFDRLLSELEQGKLTGFRRSVALLATVIEAFGTEELLRGRYARELCPALKSLGATLYASSLERIINTEFAGFDLPVTGGEDDERMQERFRNAEYSLLDAEERLTNELYRVLANCVEEHFSELFTESDLYYYYGTKEERRNLAGKKPTPKEPRPTWTKKDIKALLTAILVLIAVEGALFCLWRFAAYYPARAALESNSHIVTVESPQIKLTDGSGYRIYIRSEQEEFCIFWRSLPRMDLSAKEFTEAIKNEPKLVMTVQDSGSVCSVSGENRVYLSVEDYNRYQRTQSVFGTVLIAVFAFLGVIGFVIWLLLIKPYE